MLGASAKAIGHIHGIGSLLHAWLRFVLKQERNMQVCRAETFSDHGVTKIGGQFFMRSCRIICFVLLLSIGPAIAQQTHRNGKEVLPHHGGARIADIAEKSTVQVLVPNVARASGVWVSRGGYIATCWHVVRSATQPGEVVIRAGEISNFDLDKQEFVQFYSGRIKATVVSHDEVADVAILKAEKNPFENLSSTTHKGTSEVRFDVPVMQKGSPQPGAQVLLAGYPLEGLYLLFQFGNVAGSGLEKRNSQEIFDVQSMLQDTASMLKSVRLFVSVTSNPGNSGGPVFDESGGLLGLLRGNLSSPMKDEAQRPVLYYRPRRNESGQVVQDASGSIPAEIAALNQNSGISVVVPIYYVARILDEARTSPPRAAMCKSKPVLRQEADKLSQNLSEFLTSRGRSQPVTGPVTRQTSQDEIRKQTQAHVEEFVKHENETHDLYIQQFALRVLTLRNDFAACGVHSQRLEEGYPDADEFTIDKIINDIPTLVNKLP